MNYISFCCLYVSIISNIWLFSVGSNETWSYDGHDKLSKYSFAIHAGIDVYSRKVMWARVNITNHKPEVIAAYYLDAVREAGGMIVAKSHINTFSPIPFLYRHSPVYSK